MLGDFGIDCIDCEFDPGLLKLTYDVTGRWENDGIGPYEYWGFRGYDRGEDYFAADGYGFDREKLDRRLAGELGVELDFEDDEYDAELSDEEDTHARETRKVDVYIVDPEKAKRAAGLGPAGALGETRKRGNAIRLEEEETVSVPPEFRRMLFEGCEEENALTKRLKSDTKTRQNPRDTFLYTVKMR